MISCATSSRQTCSTSSFALEFCKITVTSHVSFFQFGKCQKQDCQIAPIRAGLRFPSTRMIRDDFACNQFGGRENFDPFDGSRFGQMHDRPHICQMTIACFLDLIQTEAFALADYRAHAQRYETSRSTVDLFLPLALWRAAKASRCLASCGLRQHKHLRLERRTQRHHRARAKIQESSLESWLMATARASQIL